MYVHEAFACCEQENPQQYGRTKLSIICDWLQIIETHQDVPLTKLVKSLDDFPLKWRRIEEIGPSSPFHSSLFALGGVSCL